MKFLSRGPVSALVVLLLSGTAVLAGSHGPTNLKVLPADISAQALNRLMKRYQQDLGVSCAYCHVEDRDTGKLDYASDENGKKQIARVMITMLEDINGIHLAGLGGDARYAASVSCGSCHRGRANPQTWEGAR